MADDGSLEVEVSAGEGVTPAVDLARIEAVVRHVLRAEGVVEGELSVALAPRISVAR